MSSTELYVLSARLCRFRNCASLCRLSCEVGYFYAGMFIFLYSLFCTMHFKYSFSSLLCFVVSVNILLLPLAARIVSMVVDIISNTYGQKSLLSIIIFAVSVNSLISYESAGFSLFQTWSGAFISHRINSDISGTEFCSLQNTFSYFPLG